MRNARALLQQAIGGAILTTPQRERRDRLRALRCGDGIEPRANISRSTDVVAICSGKRSSDSSRLAAVLSGSVRSGAIAGSDQPAGAEARHLGAMARPARLLVSPIVAGEIMSGYPRERSTVWMQVRPELGQHRAAGAKKHRERSFGQLKGSRSDPASTRMAWTRRSGSAPEVLPSQSLPLSAFHQWKSTIRIMTTKVSAFNRAEQLMRGADCYVMMLLPGQGRMSAESLAEELESLVRRSIRHRQAPADGVPVIRVSPKCGLRCSMAGAAMTGLPAPEARALFLSSLPGPPANSAR